MIMLVQFEELAARIVQLETTTNDDRAAAATAATVVRAVGGQGQDKVQDWESTLELWADRFPSTVRTPRGATGAEP